MRVLAVPEVGDLLEGEPDEARQLIGPASSAANHPATAASYAAVWANASAASAHRVLGVRPPSSRISSSTSS